MFKYTWKHQGKNKGDNYNKPFIYISYRFNTNSLRFLYKRIKRNQGGITKNKSDFYKRLHLSQVRALPQKYPPAQFTKKKKKKTAQSGLNPSIHREIPGSATTMGRQSNM
jgi:hypothetical protein